MSEVGGRMPDDGQGVSTSVLLTRWVHVNEEHLGSYLRARRSVREGGTACGIRKGVLRRLLIVCVCAKAVECVNVWRRAACDYPILMVMLLNGQFRQFSNGVLLLRLEREG